MGDKGGDGQECGCEGGVLMLKCREEEQGNGRGLVLGVGEVRQGTVDIN